MKKIDKSFLIIFISTFLCLVFSIGLITLIKINSPDIVEKPTNPPSSLAVLFMGFLRHELLIHFFLLSLIHSWLGASFLNRRVLSSNTNNKFILNSIMLTILFLILYLAYLYLSIGGYKKGIYALLWDAEKSNAYLISILYFFISLPITYWITKKNKSVT